MHVVPGSHRDPRFSPEAKKEELAALAQDPTLKTERAKMEERPASFGVPVELSTGECMFHHCLNFHATPQNTTNQATSRLCDNLLRPRGLFQRCASISPLPNPDHRS